MFLVAVILDSTDIEDNTNFFYPHINISFQCSERLMKKERRQKYPIRNESVFWWLMLTVDWDLR